MDTKTDGLSPAVPEKAIKQQTREFKMHPHLLYDVIMKQAGTVDKAILEGVMNSIDAGASSVEVTVDELGFSISDNGRGIRARTEIERFWETFGQPQEEDKIYGRLRMGRGQMFAFGKNVWRTGRFRMLVDIKKDGLNYQLEECADKVVGCRIQCEFYDQQGWYSRNVGNFLGMMCRYVPALVVVNDTAVSKNPAQEKWDFENEKYYLKLKPNEDGVAIYQQGILVETIPAYTHGLSGTVVTKVGCPLEVNFARNQVIRSCPLFKEIVAKLQALGADGLRGATKLTEAQRSQVWEILKSETHLPAGLKKARFIEDTNGTYWSVEQLERLWRKRRDFVLTFAVSDDPRADRLMQQGFVMALSEAMLSGSDLSEAGLLTKVGLSSVPYREFDDLVQHLSATYTRIPESDWTDMESRVLSLLRTAGWEVRRIMLQARIVVREDSGRVRHIGLGQSPTALSWTDGERYVMFDRLYLKECGTTEAGLCRLVQTLMHEYIHSTPSDGRHNHDMEFYQAYHEVSHHAPKLARRLFQTFIQTQCKKVKRIKQDVVDRAELAAWMQRLYGLEHDRAVEMLHEVRPEEMAPALDTMAAPVAARTKNSCD